MRLVSWNVNGLRSVLGKGFLDWLAGELPDVLCLQETRIHVHQIPAEAKARLAELGYTGTWSTTQRAGYSGTATLVRGLEWQGAEGLGPLDSSLSHWDTEGRVVATQVGGVRLFNVYFPNGTSGPERLAYKMAFYADFQRLVESLQARGESVVICGDLNTSHREIDLARPAANRGNSGFLPEECAWVDGFLAGNAGGFLDSFRVLHPMQEGAYSWWSFRGGARSRNVGWRLDYFFISQDLAPRLIDATILDHVTGSDHCPVLLELGPARG